MPQPDFKPPHRRRYFDEGKTPEDVWRVLEVASLLSVGEFTVFEVAHKWWYGRTADEDTIEHYFVPYMFKDRVPLWVRHFVTHVLERDRAGVINPRDFGLALNETTAEQKTRGGIYVLWLVTTMVFLVLVAELGVEFFGAKGCYFPPCY